MTDREGDVLFVYGTLRSRGCHQMSGVLRDNARLLGEGTVRARLYDLGDYPGMLLAENAPARVRGELHALDRNAAEATWERLEHYENPPDEGPAEFMRARVEVETTDGIVVAWAYVLIAAPPDARIIEAGDWLDRRSSAAT